MSARGAGVLPFLALAGIGAAWGATQPLSKIAVSEGYRHFGLLFWQMSLGALILLAVMALRGTRLSLAPVHLRLYLIIALIGSILPGIASYNAAVHLPSGILSILLSSVPMLAFPVALALGLERFRMRRLLGLSLGMVGVALLILPDTQMPREVQLLWVPVALLSSLCYAFEGNFVAKYGRAGLGPVALLAGASALGALICLPLALLSGQFIDPRLPWGAPDIALIASSVLHAAAYSGYVWLVGLAGSVFAVQVSYFVTLFGVGWAMLFLSEGYSGWIWAALGVMLAGMALVQPRPRALVEPGATVQDAKPL
ncbi:DMT family transporter [Tropicibacter oceani]|uniref:DMT family transporter n=1 Tax=Tropicibacter oceani TaxID=3058420 RepID=A0ABY8QCE6_9RHOB|nr:DMT family transporter [Tropicibacter oceani]WGW02285.1 DMT family transporter [Tropicibacter oceani]